MISFSDLFPSAHVREYEKGQILLYQGQRTSDVFQIKSGHVKIYDVTAQGREKLLMLLGPGDVFPIVWTFRGKGSIHYFYETFDDSKLVVTSRRKFTAAIDQNHDLAKAMLKYFVNRTQELMIRLETIEATSAKHKVIQVLLYLAASHGKRLSKNRLGITLDITHQSIADMAGVTRETASIQLKELEDGKFIKYDEASIEVNTAKLNAFLESD